MKVLGKKNRAGATVPNINLTWTRLGVNPSLHGDRPATERLKHDVTF
jgi:hypothetical protein